MNDDAHTLYIRAAMTRVLRREALATTIPRMQRVEQLFIAALDLPTAQRATFLDQECRGDDGLRQELDELLAAKRRSSIALPEPSRVAVMEMSALQSWGSTTVQAGPGHGHSASSEEKSRPPVLSAGSRLGQYELIRLLGQGGMGEVHLARDLRLGRRVAIKRLSAHGTGLMERFLSEARTTARCMHENIVVIHEVGEHNGHPYMVLEYLEGQTLRQWLREHAAASGEYAPVPPGRAVELMLPVVRALAYAHERGIVHRDLKPENVMLTRSGTIKVLDFGIAKLLSAPRPDREHSDGVPDAVVDPISGRVSGPAAVHSSALIGTLPYMSPEQMNVGVIDHRSDIWTVGIMLFELVTGRHPIPTRSVGDLMRMVADDDKPIPSVCQCMPGSGSDIGPLAGIIDRCLLKRPEHRPPSARALLAELEALAPGRRAVLVGSDGSPFAGLAAFQETDADRFFGRDHETASIAGKLRSMPLVAVTGPSGAGKSSLVRAGVIPALKRSGEGWEAMSVRPGRQPMAALVKVLLALPGLSSDHGLGRKLAYGADQSPAERDAIINRLRIEPGYLGIVLRTWARAKLRRLVLFVDQFEELYTLGASTDERACMLACLGSVADDVASPLRVILSLRSDFLDRLVEQPAFLDTVNQGLTFLPPLRRDGLREALIRPVEVCDHRFESPAMIECILDELKTTRSPLPLLQFTADKLWARRDRGQRMFTESSLHALGGVSGALAGHADTVLASMPAHDARLARTVFLRLVTPERTRAQATMAELNQLGGDADGMSRVLTRLIDARLLAVGSSARNAAEGGESDGMVEIVHESLIDTWPLLSQWLIENEDDVMFLARLRSAARDWQRSGQRPGLLWTGEAAREALTWHRRYQGELAAAEEQYLVAVVSTAEHSRRLRRQLVGGSLVVAVVIAIAMGWLAWQEAKARATAAEAAARATREATRVREEVVRADEEAKRARDATRMAVLQSMSTDPTTQIALLREIEGMSEPPPEAVQEARRLLHAGVARVVLMGHDDIVSSAAFSPDSQRIVSASFDKTVRVWNADGRGEPVVLRGHDDVVVSAAFSPDGRHIVSASFDKTVRVWNVDGRGEPVVLRGHGYPVISAAFSSDGQRIVSASFDKTVRVWSADGRGEPVVLRGHDEVVVSGAFSPDGRRIVSASFDKTVRVWSADGRGEPLVLRGHDEAVVSAAFSPDGQRIVSGSYDRTVRMWSADGRGEPLVLRGHGDAVVSAAFSPNGWRVVSASHDKTVRVWSADGRGEPLVLRGHGDVVVSAVFSPDDRRIVSASHDKTVRVWSADERGDPLVLGGHDDKVWSVGFSPDGQRIVSASYDKTVRVWSADGRGEPLVLRGHDDWVISAAFSPDGQRIVSASYDKTVRVWSADGRGEPLVLRHQTTVRSAAFSPDGRRIVSGSHDGTVRIWNADGRGEPLVLRGHDSAVMWAVFSPDGQRIVSASCDKTVRVWSVDGRGELLVLRGHEDAVRSVTFSPDGQRIVSASNDKTVRVWNANGSGPTLILRGHSEEIRGAAFSPDGMYIISASKDATVRIWRADGTGDPIILTEHSAGVGDTRFSPDGRRIVSGSEDHTVRVWRDLAPIGLNDPRLWTATTYCMSIELRTELLGVAEEMARRDRQRCLERVEQSRRAESIRPPF
jgi:WD40 repeat protein/serine/threonine protein kinase